MCVLLFLTPVFKLMPYNTMGAIIIVGEWVWTRHRFRMPEQSQGGAHPRTVGCG
jgi:hypothetical protein